MARNKDILSPNTRKRKAYTTAFIVFFSYFFLNLKSRIFGKKYKERQIIRLHRKNAIRVKNRVQELQGLFIKFGQMISILSNVLPHEFRAPLEELQDHIPPKPYKEIEETILEQTGKKPEDIFESFEKEPIAAASIGQVHRAKYKGRDIVIKIQHRNIEKIARADLTILKNLVKLHAFFMDMKGLDQMYLQVKQMIEEELDYRQEATSMQIIKKNIGTENELRVVIPEVYEEFSSSKILVAEYCPGINMGHLDEIREMGIDMDDLAARLTRLFCKMVLIDGFYHADPHPGNILVNKKGEIILLDFGAVSHLGPEMKKAIPELIEAVVKNDTESIVEAMKNMGFIAPGQEAFEYAEKLIDIFKRFLQEEVELDGLNFQNVKLNSGIGSFTKILKEVDLREISGTIQIPKDYILLYRTIILLMGNSFQLSPNLDLLGIVKPYMKTHMLGDKGLTQLILDTFKNQITTAVALPNQLNRYLEKANKGEVNIKVRELDKGFRLVYLALQQLTFTLFILGGTYILLYADILDNKGIYWTTIVLTILFCFLWVKAFLKGKKIGF